MSQIMVNTDAMRSTSSTANMDKQIPFDYVEDRPKPLQTSKLIDKKETYADENVNPLATNGVSSPQARVASPASIPLPTKSPMQNGGPTSPYSERGQSPMAPTAQIAAQTVSSRDPRAAAQQASDMKNVVRRKLTGYVGFANLPNQWHRKSVRKGFNFNVMVVGKYRDLVSLSTV